MNLIKRLRRRETNNIQQKFHYTRGILIALAQEPTLVIPVSKQAVTQLQPLKKAMKVFLSSISSNLHPYIKKFDFSTLRRLKCYTISAIFCYTLLKIPTLM